MRRRRVAFSELWRPQLRMPKLENNLTAAAIVAATAGADLSGVPAGEYEIRAGVEASVDGFNASLGIHGRLTIGRQVRSAEQLLETAFAVLLAQLGKQADAVAKSLPAALRGDDTTTAADRRRARALLRQLRKLTGVSWRATPTYKPRY